jgi:hypothetical protein
MHYRKDPPCTALAQTAPNFQGDIGLTKID